MRSSARRLVGGGLGLVGALELADLGRTRSAATSFVGNAFSSADASRGCCACRQRSIAALICDGLELHDRRAGRGDPLAEVGVVGEVLEDPVELGPGLGVPLGLDQEPGDPEPLVPVLLVDLGEDAQDDLAGDLAGGELALPEAVDARGS